jgi:prepilin-type N-terminal cleavage/methylation domain-containing protein
MSIADVPSRTGSRGFSLLELVVALAVAGVLAGVAVLDVRAMQADWRLGAAVRQVVLDLKRVRLRAIEENVDHRLLLAAPAVTYRRQRREASGGYVDVGPPTGLPEGVEIVDCTARGQAITFRPRGHASTFGTLTLRNEKGRERRVVVDMAGRLRVE